MKVSTKNVLVFFLSVALILGLVYVTAFGIKGSTRIVDGQEVQDYLVAPISEQIKFGLDLTGGVYAILEAQASEEDPVTTEKIQRAIEMIRKRVDSLGVSEPIITPEGSDRIRIELPGVRDTEEALSRIGRTAQLNFVSPDGEVLLTGAHVKEALVAYQEVHGFREIVVTLEFDAIGRDLFRQATTDYLNEVISIELDGEVISAPVVSSVITDGSAYISGNFDMDSASYLAMLIRAGSLPMDLEEVQTSLIGATLGVDAKSTSLRAGLIGLLLVFLFMMIYYKVPGFIACISLSLYVAIVISVFSGMGAVLTLPGIAGFILSIGMAVDANVIIFERLKEELRNGKTLRASIDAGFQRAFRAIIDANITTLIAGGVLYYFGTGPIKGFALTLMIGIISSMFTAIIVTKFLLKQFNRTNLVRSTKFYGI